jgi:tRNA U34 5-methylaminomethyl-2-thiouridine-forming methyltransferase MnmC
MIPQIVPTEDGSITCLDAKTGELYHNRAGAFTEALKNYVEPCNLPVLAKSRSSLRLLDVCFGLGYNVFVLLETLLGNQNKLEVQILGLDSDPTILEIVPLVLQDERFKALRTALNNASGDLIEKLRSFGSCTFTLENLRVQWETRCVDIRNELPGLSGKGGQNFDLIFHDGFSPKRMPELWTIDLFRLYADLIKPSGVILTYSAAAAVRGAFRQLGLEVRRTAAIGGKSGGTIAGFSQGLIEISYSLELTSAEETRLASRSAVPYRDPALADSRKAIIARRDEELRAAGKTGN